MLLTLNLYNAVCHLYLSKTRRKKTLQLLEGIKMIVVIQRLSRVLLFATPCTGVCQAFLSLTISLSLPKFLSIESVMLSNPKDD